MEAAGIEPALPENPNEAVCRENGPTHGEEREAMSVPMLPWSTNESDREQVAVKAETYFPKVRWSVFGGHVFIALDTLLAQAAVRSDEPTAEEKPGWERFIRFLRGLGDEVEAHREAQRQAAAAKRAEKAAAQDSQPPEVKTNRRRWFG